MITNTCPKCGGQLVFNRLFEVNHEHIIGKTGKKRKRYQSSGLKSREFAFVACKDCGETWSEDEFEITDSSKINLRDEI